VQFEGTATSLAVLADCGEDEGSLCFFHYMQCQKWQRGLQCHILIF